MPKGMLVVQSRPADPEREDEYNDWYTNAHLPEVCAVPGFVGARRYRVRGGADPSTPEYVAIYDIDCDDLEAPLQELRARAGDSRVRMSDVLQLDPPPILTLYELVE